MGLGKSKAIVDARKAAALGISLREFRKKEKEKTALAIQAAQQSEIKRLEKASGITPQVIQQAAQGNKQAQLFLQGAEKRLGSAKAFLTQNPTSIIKRTSAGVIRTTRAEKGFILGQAAAIATGGESALKEFRQLFARQTSVLESAKGGASGESAKAGLLTTETGSAASVFGEKRFSGKIIKRTLEDSISISDTGTTKVTDKKGKTIAEGILTGGAPKSDPLKSFRESKLGPPPIIVGGARTKENPLGVFELVTERRDPKRPITKELQGQRQDFPRSDKLIQDFNISQFLTGTFEGGLLPFGQFLATSGQTVKDITQKVDPQNILGLGFNPAIEERTASVKSLFKGLGAKETKASSGIREIVEGSRVITTSSGPLFVPGIPKVSQFGASFDAGSLLFDLGLIAAPTRKIPSPIKAPALKLVTDSGEVKTIIRELSIGLGPLEKPVLTKTQAGFSTGGVFKPGVLEKSSLREITAPGESLEFSSGGKFSTKILTSPQTQDILRGAGKGLARDKEIVALKTELAGLIEFSAKKVPDSIRVKVKVLPETPLSTVAKGAESKALRTEVFPIAPRSKGSFAETIQLESKFLARQSKNPLANLKTLREKTTKDLDSDFGELFFGTFRAKRFQEKSLKFLSRASSEIGKFKKVGTNIKLAKSGETVLNILTKRDATSGGSLSKPSKFPFGIKIERSVNVLVELGSKKTAEFVTIEENALNRLRAGLGLFSPISTKAKDPSQKTRFLKPGFEERIKTPSGFGVGPGEFGLKHDAKLIGQDAPQIAENLVAAGFIKEGQRTKAIGLRLEQLLEEIDVGVLPVEKAVGKSSSSSISKGIEGIVKEGPDIAVSQIPSTRFFHGTDDPEKILKEGITVSKEVGQPGGFFVTKDIGFAKKFGSNVLEVKLSPKAKIVSESASTKNPLAVFKGDNEFFITSKLAIKSITKPTSKPLTGKPLSKPLTSSVSSSISRSNKIGSSLTSSIGSRGLGKGSKIPSSLGVSSRGIKVRRGGAPSSLGVLTGSPGSPGLSPGRSPGSPGKPPGSPGLTGFVVPPGPGSAGSISQLTTKGPGLIRTSTIKPLFPFINIGAIVKRSKPEPRKRRVDFLGNTLISDIRSFRTRKEDIRHGRITIDRIASKELQAAKHKKLIDDERGTKKISGRPRFSSKILLRKKVSKEKSLRFAQLARL